MEIFQIILFITVFLVIALAMFFRKIPAVIALPLMAFIIPLIGGVSLTDTIQLVVGEGSLKLHNAYTVALFGSMLSILLQKTGVAENFIKIGAELAGDNPWIIAVIMLSLITMLFTTLGGLGAIIMVATIVLPIMSSVGIGPMTVVGVFLFGLSMGGILNAGNWAVYVDVMGLTLDQIRPFALIMFGLTFITSLVYLTVQIYRDGHELNFTRIIIVSSIVFTILLVLYIMYSLLPIETQQMLKSWINFTGLILKYMIGTGISLLFIINIIRIFIRKKQELAAIHWTAYFTPLIPLFLILIFSMNFIAAFICGLVYGFMSTYRKGSLNMFIQSVFEGGAVVMPAVVLMLGIGMLLNAIIGPGESWSRFHAEGWPVLNLLRPVMMEIVPEHAISYVVIFGLAAPLALYRGPLNVWGMGYGLAAVFLASGMNAGAIMGLLLAVGQVQGISDPTNTHNVWLANEMQQNVQKILWNTIPYTWSLAFLGLFFSALIFM
ncbi:MAG: citrate transporter [Calditrichaeota bacterium]|nr:citrate transporter [Calditrichota bacterium]RQW07282.1 MAG: citrate transporter [Calditrichota bacterium]